MGYWMYSEDRTRGDSGGMSDALTADEAGREFIDVEHDARPRVGVYMKVGSVYARTMQEQDWWRTNKITEILEDTPNCVKFKTKSGTIYEWRCD